MSAPVPARGWKVGAGAGGAFAPRDVSAIGLCIERLEALEQGPALEAAIFRALGWRVEPAQGRRAAGRVRSPLSSAWMPLPPVTRSTDGAAILVPFRWSWGCGRRDAHGFAWVRRDERTFFEARSGPPAVLLSRAALHAWRRILLETLP